MLISQNYCPYKVAAEKTITSRKLLILKNYFFRVVCRAAICRHVLFNNGKKFIIFKYVSNVSMSLSI